MSNTSPETFQNTWVVSGDGGHLSRPIIMTQDKYTGTASIEWFLIVYVHTVDPPNTTVFSLCSAPSPVILLTPLLREILQG